MSVDAGKKAIEAHETLDACGLNCPLPLLKAKQALNKLKAGEVLHVICTDAGSERDFQVFSEQSGHQILKSTIENNEYRYWIRKKV
ncbi:MAG: sulfurtransferase TusA family protein [Gammaproteobacteria bacterium]|nr:sulfurtransferase TusA family protein [Gammaproteobacteria bacterium]